MWLSIQIKDAPLSSIQATFTTLNSVLNVTWKLHTYMTFLNADRDTI